MVIWFALVFLVLAVIQIAVVVRVHSCRITGPFLVGDAFAAETDAWPREMEIHRHSVGYDGQFFIALAFDPFLRTDLLHALDNPRYRARRITWSMAAWLFGAGRPSLIVVALIVLNLVAIAGGAVAISSHAAQRGGSMLWGLAFAVSLGSIVCLSRMLGDAIMASLLAVSLHLSVSKKGKAIAWACVFLGLAILQKETALLAVPVLLWSLQPGRSSRGALAGALAVPFLWWAYVWFVAPSSGVSVVAANFGWPGEGLLAAAQLALTADRGFARLFKDLGLLGLHALAILTAAGLSVSLLARFNTLPRCVRGLAVAAALYSLMGALLAVSVWTEPWAYARTLLPLFVVLFFLDVEQEAAQAGPRFQWLGRGLLCANAVAGLAFLAKDLILKTP